MENNIRFYGGLSFLYGVIFTFCLYRNFTGITFPVYVAATIFFAVLFIRKTGVPIKRKTCMYFINMQLLGISTFLTANGFFHFFNWAGIILLFMAAMIHQFYEEENWGFQTHLKNLFVLMIISIASIGTAFSHSHRYLKTESSGKRKKILAVVLGLGLAFLTLLIVLPLLIYSDKVFEKYFMAFFKYISLANIAGIVFTFLYSAICLYAFFVAVLKNNLAGPKTANSKKADAIIGISFTAVLAIIYIIYSAIQILFLFLRWESGLPQDVTYSQYARAGFWQLLVVSLINFILVLICIQVFRENKVLKVLLLIISLCTCIMTASAVYRMLLYVNAYHLTFLRVLVLWFLAVLTLIMGGVIINICKVNFHLFQYIMLVVACGYLLFSFARVDWIIANYNIEHIEIMSERDVYYLVDHLSLDAAPAILKLDPARAGEDKYYIEEVMNGYIKSIKRQPNSGRRWNYSIYLAQKSMEKHLQDSQDL